MRSAWARRCVLTAFGLVLSVSCLIVQPKSETLQDDCFIAFRYVQNVLKGLGPVFNENERVWGYTSPLHVFILSVAGWVGLDVPSFSVTLSTLSILVAAAFLTLALASLLRLPSLIFVFALMATIPHYNPGMEGGLLVALQAAFLFLALRGKWVTAGWVGALSCLTRPDSVLLVIPILLLERVWTNRRAMAAFLVPGLSWMIFTGFYYGSLLPNTFFSKRGHTPFGVFFLTGIESMSGYVDFHFFKAFQPFCVALPFLALVSSRFRKSKILTYTFLAYPWILLIGYAKIGPGVGFQWEYYSAAFFFLAGSVVGLALAAQAPFDMDSPLGGFNRASRLAIVFLSFSLGILMVKENYRSKVREFEHAQGWYWRGARYETYRRIAAWFKDHLPPDSVIAMSEPGTIAYFSGMRVLDLAWLVSKKPEENSYGSPQDVPRYWLAYHYQERPRKSGWAAVSYEPIQYFEKEGFEDFTLMRRADDRAGVKVYAWHTRQTPSRPREVFMQPQFTLDECAQVNSGEFRGIFGDECGGNAGHRSYRRAFTGR